MATAKVIIKGDNQLSGPLKSAKGELSGFEAMSKKVGDSIKKAFTLTAVIVAVKELASTAKACFNEFSQANRAYKQLALTVKDTTAYSSAIQTIDELSRQTLTSKDQIESMVAELSALGKSSEEVDKISSAAVYLSNVTGKDLNSSMTTLLNTYKGTTTQLNKLGIDTSNLTKEQLKNGAAVDIVVEKFENLSKSMAEADTNQHITNIKNTFGDLRQQVGGIADYNFGPMIANFDNKLHDTYGNIVSVINYIGAVIKNFPQVAGRSLALVGEMIQRILSWNFISGLIQTTIDNMITIIRGLIELIPKILPDALSFIFTSAVAMIERIGAFVLKTFESLISGIVNALANTGLGEFLGLKKIDINLGSAKLGAKADATQSQANAYAEAIGGRIDEIVSTVKETSGEVSDRTKNFFRDQFGDILEGYADDINTIVAPTLKEIEVAADVTQQAVVGVATGVEGIEEEIKSETFLEKLGGKIGKAFGGLFGGSEEQSGLAGNKIMDYFTSSLGDAGQVASELATNMATMGPLLGAIVTAIKYVIEGFAETFGEILNEFVKYGLEPIKEIGRVIGRLLKPVLEEVMPLVQKVADFLIGIFDAVGTALMPIIQIITSSLTPILDVISNILEALTPVIKFFAKVIVTITGTIQYVIQTLQHWVATLMNWLAGINILGWKPFKGLKMTDPGAPGKYSDYINGKWSEIDAGFAESSSGTSTANSTAISSAGYQGATHVTINIYQEAPVVGDGGMRQFASMIRNEFDNLDYYGVTA